MEISKDPETGQVVTISRVLLPALKREQHGSELSCEVDSTTLSKRKTVLISRRCIILLPQGGPPGRGASPVGESNAQHRL